MELKALAEGLGVTFINLEIHPERKNELRLNERGYIFPNEEKVELKCFLLYTGPHFDVLIQGQQNEASMEWIDNAGGKLFFSVAHYGLVNILY